MWRRLGVLRQFKLNLIRLARLHSAPDEVGRGMALGMFVGFTPTFGVQLPIALVLAFLLRQNKIAAFVGVWVTNPLTAPVIYGLEYQIGRLLLGMPPFSLHEFHYQFDWMMGVQVGAPLLLGSLVLGLPVALIGYTLTVYLVPGMRQWKIPRWPRPRIKP